MTQKLKEKRDELAAIHAKEYEEEYSPSVMVLAQENEYKEAFNAACNLLLPEIEKLSAALEFCLKNYLDIPCEKSKSDGILTTGRIEANRALQSLREFLGTEAENE